MLTIILVIAAVLCLVTAVICRIAERSPIGYEDRDGWHEGERR